jgi:LCP family protein required for cell wall assembly
MNRLSPKLPTPKKVRIRRVFKLISRSFWSIIILILIWQLFQLNLFLDKTKSSNLDQASAQVEQLQKELDEIREYLLIPTQPDNEDANSTKSDQSVDQFLDTLLVDYERSSQKQLQTDMYLKALNQSYNKLEENIKQLTAYSLSKIDSEGQSVLYELQKNTDEQVILTFGFDSSKLIIDKGYTQTKYVSNQLEKFEADLLSFSDLETLTKQQEKSESATQVQQEFIEISNSENLDFTLYDLAESKSLKLDYDSDKPFVLSGLKQDNAIAFTLNYNPESKEYKLLDAKQSLIGKSSTTLKSLLPSLETYLKLNTFPTLIQKNVEDKISQFQQVVLSQQFQKKMSSQNLIVKENIAENEYALEFLNKRTNILVFRIVIDRTTAEVYKEQNQIKTQISFLSPIKNSAEGQKTYLIAGKHGNLTDTLMLANVDEKSQAVTLLSLPRDLYIEGRKINAIYAKDGIEALKSNIETISGRQIDNYFLIDMYAFIDVVDYLGGVNIYLENEVIDPTYKTFDNGVWGTMYFAAGEHTLNGTQALRLARSRFTSSDFVRAERQQQILSGLKTQITTLGFTDAKAISQIAATMVSKTETNISLNKAISAFFKYKNYTLKTNNVLSTNNILVSTYSNEYNNVSCENCGKGAYILVPKNNDWSLLKTYLNQVFST